jgi:serine protease AprX
VTIKILGLVISIILASPATWAQSYRQQDKIAPFVKRQMSRTGTMSVIVTFKERANLGQARSFVSKTQKGVFVFKALRDVAMHSQKDLSAYLKMKNISFRNHYIANMMVIEKITPPLIQEIAARPEVARIIGNPRVRGSLPRIPTPVAMTDGAVVENISATGATRVWEELKITGKGIVVAGNDTGVHWEHPAIRSQYRGLAQGGVDHRYSWHDSIHNSISGQSNPCGYNTKAPCDDNGHGTHTIGTVAGGAGGQKIVGMAPEAKWIACRNMDEGVGTPATYIECFEFFLAPYPQGSNGFQVGDPTKAPHVINNSWGCPESEGCEGKELAPVVQALRAAGIMVVVSAGNSGSGCASIEDQPATLSRDTLTVGAIDHRNGTIARFSSRGPSVLDGGLGPDVSAPGVAVISSIPPSRYASYSGTSMAGPHVAGQVALIWSAKPALIGNVEATTALIAKTASPKTASQDCGGIPGSQIPNNTYGFGNIDAYKSVSSVLGR